VLRFLSDGMLTIWTMDSSAAIYQRGLTHNTTWTRNKSGLTWRRRFWYSEGTTHLSWKATGPNHLTMRLDSGKHILLRSTWMLLTSSIWLVAAAALEASRFRAETGASSSEFTSLVSSTWLGAMGPFSICQIRLRSPASLISCCLGWYLVRGRTWAPGPEIVGGCSEPRIFFLPNAKVTPSQIMVAGYGPQREQTISPGKCCSFT